MHKRVEDATTVQYALGREAKDAAAEQLLDDLAPSTKDAPHSRRLGRYVLLHRLGAGGMGTVYLAHDPQLERNVAIKVLRDRVIGEDARARLLREAQAMAKLSHPNVVDVYDVGLSALGVYIAMEFVDGNTLDMWTATTHPDPTTILRVCIGAGRGVAAAHTAGFVHRDLKPSNILVADGPGTKQPTGLVVDFGLARATRPTESEQGDSSNGSTTIDSDALAPHQSSLSHPGHAIDALESPLTEEGIVVGTPAYMAPEQRAGARPTAASDQYSFCVTVFKALYGHRPDQRPAVDDLDSPPQTEPTKAERRLLARAKSVLERGLQRDPDLRFASMQALLRALERVLVSGSYRARYAAVVLAGIGATAGLAMYASDPKPTTVTQCDGAQQRLRGIWDFEQKQTLQATFAAIPKAFAAESWALAERKLDQYTNAWVTAYNGACEATHVLGKQSEAQLDARMRCLETRRAELAVTVTALGETNAQTAKLAIPQIDALAPVDPCNDVDALLATVPPPEDPSKIQPVEDLKASIRQAMAWRRAGKLPQSKHLALSIVEDAGAIGYPPIEAEALENLGHIQYQLREVDAALESWTRAYELASQAGHDFIAARVAMQLLVAVAAEYSRFEDADKWSRHARSSLDRYRSVGGYQTRYLESQLQNNMGAMYSHKGEHKLAQKYFQRALEAKRSLLGESHAEVATILRNLGICAHHFGDNEKSYALLERSIEIQRDALGGNHPEVMTALATLAAFKVQTGRLEESEALYEEVFEIAKGSVGLDHPHAVQTLNSRGYIASVRGDDKRAIELTTEGFERCRKITAPASVQLASCHSHLAIVYSNANDEEKAHSHFAKAFEIGLKSFGPNHPGTAQMQAGLGVSLTRLKRYKEAQAHIEAALKVRQAVFGDNHFEVSKSQHDLAQVLREQGHDERALGHFRLSLGFYTDTGSEDHPDARLSLLGIGKTQLKLGRPHEAAEAFRRVLAPVKPDAEAPPDTAKVERTAAEAKFGLAQALLRVGGDREQALALSQESLAFFESGGQEFAQEAHEVEVWRASQ